MLKLLRRERPNRFDDCIQRNTAAPTTWKPFFGTAPEGRLRCVGCHMPNSVRRHILSMGNEMKLALCGVCGVPGAGGRNVRADILVQVSAHQTVDEAAAVLVAGERNLC
ncbi:hypothetical protein [Nocardia sp. CY41]|uniref:hypothetical protein n=1 Tax=Nocardia sp. CY41 TaxID=2608686 RepID=UPI0013587065|nr:hypothetical protein [Nocardia sp. CY41]